MTRRTRTALAADNNVSSTRLTQFIVLAVSAVPEPGSWALLLAGVLGRAGHQWQAMARGRRQLWDRGPDRSNAPPCGRLSALAM